MTDKFQPTRWSMIRQASLSSSEKNREKAWSQIYQLYRLPLLTFIKFNNRTHHDPEDLLQSFFSYLSSTGSLSHADQTKGKCRTFLITILKRFMNDSYKASIAQKRGGRDAHHLSIEDDLNIPDEAQQENPHSFDIAWAKNLVDITLRELEQEATQKGSKNEFTILKHQLSGSSEKSIVQAAKKLGKSPDSLRMALNRLKKRFQIILRDQVAQTLAPGESISSELRYLADLMASKD